MARANQGDLADGRRYGCGTWTVPTCALPAVAQWMTRMLPMEQYDPSFHGQQLSTTYFDTLNLHLRKARDKGKRYMTLRIRRYDSSEICYALSAKTEQEKWRQEIEPALAESLLQPGASVLPLLGNVLPANLLARAEEISQGKPLGAAVLIRCRRYAVESDAERITLDVDVRTDTDKAMTAGVLEYKSTQEDAQPPTGIALLGLRPIKLSKFLWATDAE